MFFHILRLQRDVYWQFCDIAYAAYPLDEIDSIDVQTGDVNSTSAINVVAFGEDLGHLDLMEGVIVELLKQKWEKFAKKQFFRQIKFFFIYFVISLIAFTLRPAPEIPPETAQITPIQSCPEQYSTVPKVAETPLVVPKNTSAKYICWGQYCYNNTRNNKTLLRIQRDAKVPNSTKELDTCYLLRISTPLDVIRRVFEVLTLIGAILYASVAFKEMRRLGFDVFLQTWSTVPGRVMFMISCILIIISLPMRLICQPRIEDRLVAAAMFLTPMHFLFFCRSVIISSIINYSLTKCLLPVVSKPSDLLSS